MHIPVGQPHAQGFIPTGYVVQEEAINNRIDQRYIERPPQFLMPEHLTPENLDAKYAGPKTNVVLQSPDGVNWQLSISNDGAIIATPIP